MIGFDDPYRPLIGRHKIVCRWSQLIEALVTELADYRQGSLKDQYYIGTAKHYDADVANVVE
jgi:hypothetical protein